MSRQHKRLNKRLWARCRFLGVQSRKLPLRKVLSAPGSWKATTR